MIINVLTSNTSNLLRLLSVEHAVIDITTQCTLTLHLMSLKLLM